MGTPLKKLGGWMTGRWREVIVMFSDLSMVVAPAKRKIEKPAALVRKQPLVKSRPASLEQRYQMIDDQSFGDEVFARLQSRLFNMANHGLKDQHGAKIVYKERGRVAPDRPYFYLKPSGASGLLFERSGPGWVVSRAEKIVDRDLFLREGDVLEHANIFLATDRTPLPRIKSDQLGNELLAYTVYEQKLLKHLGLE